MSSKINRNDPCPCGSGKKYKKCCLLKEYSEIGPEDSVKKTLIQELLKFAHKRYGGDIPYDALEIFWDDFNPVGILDQEDLDAANINFFEWLILDWVADEERDKTLIDLYIDNNRLTKDELAILRKLKASVLSLHEVQEAYPGEGLLVEDLILGGTYRVKERTGSRLMVKWDIFAARLLEIDGNFIIVGGIYGYPVRRKQFILDDMKQDFESYKKDWPTTTWRSYLKENGDIFNYYWYEPIQNPPNVEMRNTAGEAILLSKSIFKIKDKKSAVSSLSKIKDIEKDGDDFIWLGGPDKIGGRTILGLIKINADKLILECNSKKRLQKGKAFIAANIDNSVEHKTDTFQDLSQAIEEESQMPDRHKEEKLPIELQQELRNRFMQNHCEAWLNESVPALGGKTPLQAIKTKAGKEKVRELLKLFENSEERNKRQGEPFYDLSWLRKELKID